MFCYNPLFLLLISQLLGDALISSNSVKPRSKRGLHHHTSKLSIKDLALELLLKTVDEQSDFEKAKKNVHILQRDSCTNIKSVGKPVTHNTRYHTYGAWMKDPLGVMGFETVFSMGNYKANVVHEFANMDMFKAGVARKRYSLPYTCDGTGAVVYGPYLYFNRANTHYIVKYNLQTQRVDAQIRVSGYQPRKNHYSWDGFSGMDLAVDEQGLWVLWGSTLNSYRLHASKIDLYQNTIIQTWSLNTERMSSMGNAFVACGVIYAIDSYNSKITTINFAYDTKTSKQWNPNIQFTNQYGYNSMVDYNPREKVLYAWDNKFQVTYPITFEKQLSS